MLHLFRTKSVEQTIAETGEEGHELKRNLKWWDLAIMGVAVAVGAGIFSVGAQAAAFHAGPSSSSASSSPEWSAAPPSCATPSSPR